MKKGSVPSFEGLESPEVPDTDLRGIIETGILAIVYSKIEHLNRG